MKIIHCADFHLNSNMQTHLNKEKASIRNDELLQSFRRLVAYARGEHAAAVLIAGDLFDTDTPSMQTAQSVLGVIRAASDIQFYYISGNHDPSILRRMHQQLPENLWLFPEPWTAYLLSEYDGSDSRVCVYGCDYDIVANSVNHPSASFSADGLVIDSNTVRDSNNKRSDFYAGLQTNPAYINLVMLHGQLVKYLTKSNAENIPLNQLENKGIDYLALGHVHRHQRGTLFPNGSWCYPGCPEGRGFDEAGVHGFVVLDIDEEKHQIETQFIPFATRVIYSCTVDISECEDTLSITEKIDAVLAEEGCTEVDMVEIILTDVRHRDDLERRLVAERLEQRYADYFFACRVRVENKTSDDYRFFEKEASLKGEFIRVLQEARDLSEEERSEIASCGLRVLRGEEV